MKKALIKRNKEVILHIASNNVPAIVDALYGLVWHKINEGLHEGKTIDDLPSEYDILSSINPEDEILKELRDSGSHLRTAQN
jgi:hypothetical protein